MKCEQCGRACPTGTRGSPKRFCGARCRLRRFKARKKAEIPEGVRAEAKETVKARSEEGRAYALRRKELGRKWFRSKYADLLEARGLPGHCCIAAEMLGIQESTLRKRLKHGTDLLAPLRASTRNPAQVVLVPPTAKQLKGIRILETSAQKRLSETATKLGKREDLEV